MSEQLPSDEVFIVIKAGVYRHDIVGVFYREDDAKIAAENAAKLEPDDYHSFELVKMKVGDGPGNLFSELYRTDAKHIVNGRYVIDSSSYMWKTYE